MSEVKYGIIGYNWGQKYAKNLSEVPNARLSSVCCRTPIKSKTSWTPDYRRLCESDVDAVIIATPPTLHFEMARCALMNGKHVICEKPFVLRLDDALKLAEIAHQYNLNLVTNFIHLFNPDYQKLKDKFRHGEDDWVVVIAEFLNYGPFRRDCSALWDWMPHPISLCLDFQGKVDDIGVLGSDARFPKSSNLLCARLIHGNDISWITTGNYYPLKRYMFSVTSQFGTMIYADDGKNNSLLNLLNVFTSAVAEKRNISNTKLAIDVTDAIRKIEEKL